MSELAEAGRKLEGAYVDWLYSRAAAKLAARPVRLEWIEPLLPGARGLTLRDGDQALIQIRPDLDPGQRFKTFLHEAAHARLHYSGLADRRDFDQVLEVREVQGKRAAPEWLMSSRKRAADQRETEAAELAETWAAQVANLNTIRAKLQALLD